MSFLAAAAIGAGVGAAGNLLGSASQSAMGYYMSKHMAKYNYDLQKKGYLEFPTAQVAGLRAAGINPMVAYGGIAGAQAHAGNYQAAPGSDLGTSAMDSYREGKKVDPMLKNIQADTDAKHAQAGAAQAQAGAAADQGKASLINAMTNAKRVQAEIDLMEKQGSNLDVSNPNESGWGAADRYFRYGSDLMHSAGTAAAIYGISKGFFERNKPILMKENGSMWKVYPKTGLRVPYNFDPPPKSKPSVFSRAVNSAKKVVPYLWPALAIGSKAIGGTLGTLGTYGSIKAGEKARETIKKDKKSDYNQGHKYRVPNAFGIPTYW